MSRMTVKTAEEALDRLGLTWADADMAHYSIFTDRPYWAVKFKVPATGRYYDYVTFRVHPSSVQAMFDRIEAAKNKKAG